MEQSYELCKFYNAEQGCKNGKSCLYNPESPTRCWKFLYPYAICEHFDLVDYVLCSNLNKIDTNIGIVDTSINVSKVENNGVPISDTISNLEFKIKQLERRSKKNMWKGRNKR